MWHNRRVHGISVEDDLESLVKRVDGMTWTVCSGFAEGLAFLNDATGPDGAQEFAGHGLDTGERVEILTVSWMAFEDLACAVRCIDVDTGDRDRTAVSFGYPRERAAQYARGAFVAF